MLWLKKNTDKHQPLQGQKRIAKKTEATQTITELYHPWSLIMPQHDSKYFDKFLEKNAGTISSKNVSLGNKVLKRNLPEHLPSKVDIKEDDSTNMENLGSA